MAQRLLITGGAGFIGSNFIRHVFRQDPDARITNIDALTYAGTPANVSDLNRYPGHTFVRGDIRDAALIDEVMPGHDAVIHFAAESHVDRSIVRPGPFLETNVVGTGVLLEAALRTGVRRFLHVSTDEVYGPVTAGQVTEDARLEPSSAYSASKAGSDLLVRSYQVTHGLDAVIGRSTNNFGPFQMPEKLIPRFITHFWAGRRVPLYGNGLHEREWLHVDDHCEALLVLLARGSAGETYNIGSGTRLRNVDVARAILDVVGGDDSWIEYVPDRPGHDVRYAVDSSKIRSLGWAPTRDFTRALTDTIDWYRQREDWWRSLVT